MKTIISTLLAKAMLLTAILCTFTAAADTGVGGEYFEVYLNDKLMIQQGITASYKVKNLPLASLTASDKLVIHYRNCHNVIAKGRSVAIKDANGKILKEWKFEDSKESAMVITGNEILQLRKQHPTASLKLFYTSTEFSEDRTLASLQFRSDETVYNH